MVDDNGVLSRGAILAADDRRLERVDVPEWGGRVFVRVMTGTQRDALEEAMASRPDGQRDLKGLRARLAAYTVCDQAGELLFGEQDIPALSEKSSVVLDRIFATAQRVNRMRASDIEELLGNSRGGPSAASGSS